jgi:CRISPR/Cas system endoribonuclease Cas6 (RAMP superfamily)
MPLPTAMDIHKITNELLMLASKVDEMKFLVSSSKNEIIINAYKTLHDDFEWKLRKRINDFWLYTTGSKDTLD